MRPRHYPEEGENSPSESGIKSLKTRNGGAANSSLGAQTCEVCLKGLMKTNIRERQFDISFKIAQGITSVEVLAFEA